MIDSALAQFVRGAGRRIRHDCAAVAEGTLTRVVGMTLEASGLNCALGQRCLIRAPGVAAVQAEVVGFNGERVFLMPAARVTGLRPGLRVRPVAAAAESPGGDGLLGRVLRAPIRRPLDVGVRSINALLTVGRGQRLGIFAGSGVGKSMLLGMMTRFTEADVTVVGLVGERGREAREFIEDILGEEGMRRAVVVVSPADDAPLMRMRCARLATRIAEDFRDRGRNVLLLMDSLTRFAQAQREIGLWPRRDSTRRSMSRPRFRAPCRRSPRRCTGRRRRSSRSCTRATSRTAT